MANTIVEHSGSRPIKISPAVYRARHNDGTSDEILSGILGRLTSLERSIAVTPCQSPAGDDQSGLPTLSYNGNLAPFQNNGQTLECIVGLTHPGSRNATPSPVQDRLSHSPIQTTSRVPIQKPETGDELMWNDSSITKDMATKWVNSFYYLLWGPQLPLPKDFFLQLPELFGLPHIKIDTSAVLVYHNILLQGLFMDRDLTRNTKQYASYVYSKILRQVKDWDFETQPTLTDLYAALLTNSWRFHCSAYRIACNLGFLLLDADGSGNNQSLPTQSIHKNQMRFCVWQLVHNDCLFRLHLGKPGLIDPRTLVVKFPELSTWNPHEGLNRSVQITFLVSTRLAFAKMRCFDLIDDMRRDGSQPCDQIIENLIRETQTALMDWKIDESLEAVDCVMSAWLYDELIQNACSTIILLNRTRSVSNSQTSKLQSHEAVRRAIEIMKRAMIVSHFTFYSVPVILTLFAHILATNQLAVIAQDMSLTAWVGTMLVEWTAQHGELEAIEAVVSTLNDLCRRTKLCTSGIYGQPHNEFLTGMNTTDGFTLDPRSTQTLDRIGIKAQDLIQNPSEMILVIERWIYSQGSAHDMAVTTE
ncbi:fungal specific transcription factor domain-containing protein [Aspergillus alliaceus]|uniref:fungal specific transcription factor domain-containing protein n=1 Tax=Petromyces alliaceus TaxID=209559 RepID=UPI0012A4F965|nr:uncharacterized protein BDW43DRAFT_300982 [Aspergillus alliaceus]KAB8232660.1 hypothetical protein BDW43DRAFT_300982 [Aspergillus alliaceus]